MPYRMLEMSPENARHSTMHGSYIFEHWNTYSICQALNWLLAVAIFLSISRAKQGSTSSLSLPHSFFFCNRSPLAALQLYVCSYFLEEYQCVIMQRVPQKPNSNQTLFSNTQTFSRPNYTGAAFLWINVSCISWWHKTDAAPQTISHSVIVKQASTHVSCCFAPKRLAIDIRARTYTTHML